jgi:hypothetical protein
MTRDNSCGSSMQGRAPALDGRRVHKAGRWFRRRTALVLSRSIFRAGWIVEGPMSAELASQLRAQVSAAERRRPRSQRRRRRCRLCVKRLKKMGWLWSAGIRVIGRRAGSQVRAGSAKADVPGFLAPVGRTSRVSILFTVNNVPGWNVIHVPPSRWSI